MVSAGSDFRTFKFDTGWFESTGADSMVALETTPPRLIHSETQLARNLQGLGSRGQAHLHLQDSLALRVFRAAVKRGAGVGAFLGGVEDHRRAALGAGRRGAESIAIDGHRPVSTIGAGL